MRVVNEEGGYATVREEAIEDAFYHLCTAEDVALSKSLLQPEALQPLMATVEISDENYGRVPRVYIEALQDHAVTLPLQKYFQEKLPCNKVISIDSDHSAFFSRPAELIDALLNLSESV